MDKRVDLAGSLALILFAIVILVAAYRFTPPLLRYDAIGPMGFPIAIGLLLLLGGALQSYRNVRFLQRSPTPYGPHEGKADDPEHPASTARGLGFVAGGIAYVLLLPVLGYFVATPVAVAAALWAMNFKGWLARVIVSVASTLVGYLVFGLALGVPLPAGLLPFAGS